MNKETPFNILRLLYDYYDKNPTGVLPTYRIAELLKITIAEAQGGCIYLKDKNFIKSFQRFDDQWTQKISADGIDEIEKRINQSANMEYDSTHLLDLELENDDFDGIMKVFISHKFVKKDQKLALRLQEMFRERQIRGYMAERKRDYQLLISDKIKNEILESDFVVGIITKEAQTSASVNQELGYAMGKEKPVILMLEKGIEHGVLTYGKEVEEFDKNSFEKKCKNIIEYLVENKPERLSEAKPSPEEKTMLEQNVYRPCYNQMKNVYERREFINNPPENKWLDIEHFLKLKTEPDMKDLFEKYTSERSKYHELWVPFANKAQSQQHKMGKILAKAFKKSNLMVNDNSIGLTGNSSIDTKDWFQAFSMVLLDPEIKNSEELYQKLADFSINTQNGHSQWLEKWWNSNNGIYWNILELIPELIRNFNCSVTKKQLDKQREMLRKSIEELTQALEEKLKN